MLIVLPDLPLYPKSGKEKNIRIYPQLSVAKEKKRLIFGIPLSIPSFLFKCLGLFAQGRAEFYRLQLNKIAVNSIYSADKLRATGVQLMWNLKNTLSKTVEWLSR